MFFLPFTCRPLHDNKIFLKFQSSSQSMSSSTLCDPQSCSNSVTSLPAQFSSAISLCTQTMVSLNEGYRYPPPTNMHHFIFHTTQRFVSCCIECCVGAFIRICFTKYKIFWLMSIRGKSNLEYQINI